MASDAQGDNPNADFEIPPLSGQFEILPPLVDFRSPPKSFPVCTPQPIMPIFADAHNKECPLCHGTKLAPVEWTFADKEKKTTFTIDAFGTALVNTMAVTIAAQTGNEKLATDLGAAIIELIRLYFIVLPQVTGQSIGMVTSFTKEGAESLTTVVEAQADTLSQATPEGDELDILYDQTEKNLYDDGEEE